MEGFISIHRSLLEWEWWDDHNTTRLFLYLLLKANFQDKKWQGIDIKRGQMICSYDKIKKETGLSIMKIRTSINKLILTGSLTIQSTNKYTVITVCKYDSYQLLKNTVNKQNNTQNNNPVTNKQQTNNKQITTTNNENNNNKENNVNNLPPNPQKNDEEKIQLFGSKNQYDFSKIKWALWKTKYAEFERSIFDCLGSRDSKFGIASVWQPMINEKIEKGISLIDPQKVLQNEFITHLKNMNQW